MSSLQVTTRPGAAARAVAPRPRRGRRRARRQFLADTVMVAPALALVVVFIIVPIGIAIYLSLTNWDGFSPNPGFVGLANYREIFHDSQVAQAAIVTGIITVTGTVLANVIGLGLAMLVNGSGRFKAIARGVLFYPYIIGAIIIGFLWSAILGSDGAIDSVLQSLGSSGIPFLATAGWALASVVFVIVWANFGVTMVLYLAGLQTLPGDLIEASVIDGANAWQTFWRVKLPLLAPVVTINVVLMMISLLRTYELVLALTEGGPAGTTQTIAYYILNISFADGKLGYGAAQAVLLMIVIIAATVVLTTMRRRAEKDIAA
jgi:raffinose/stachyose/melibiose transport system permease protein